MSNMSKSMSFMSQCFKTIPQLGASVVNVDQKSIDPKPTEGRRLSFMKSNAPTESDIQFLRKSLPMKKSFSGNSPSPMKPLPMKKSFSGSKAQPTPFQFKAPPPRCPSSSIVSHIESATSCVFNLRMDQSMLRSTLSRPQFYLNLAKSVRP